MARMKKQIVNNDHVLEVLNQDLVIASEGNKKLFYNPKDQVFLIFHNKEIFLIDKNQEMVLEEYNKL